MTGILCTGMVAYFKPEYSRGIQLATKHVMMAALCYNLKKYLRHTSIKQKRYLRLKNLCKKKQVLWFPAFFQTSFTSSGYPIKWYLTMGNAK
jgi:polysaccharide pyruvyl transferase WcaK-like protein